MTGTHLVEVDCNGCGAYIYAVPAYLDTALCAACGRVKAGITGEPEPGRWGVADVTTGAREPRAPVASVPLPYPVTCPQRPPCPWRSDAPDYVTAQRMASVHRQVWHEPWLSRRAYAPRR